MGVRPRLLLQRKQWPRIARGISDIDDEPVVNLGTRYTLGKHFTLLASAGRGFREEPKLLGYLGLRLNF